MIPNSIFTVNNYNYIFCAHFYIVVMMIEVKNIYDIIDDC